MAKTLQDLLKQKDDLKRIGINLDASSSVDQEDDSNEPIAQADSYDIPLPPSAPAPISHPVSIRKDLIAPSGDMSYSPTPPDEIATSDSKAYTDKLRANLPETKIANAQQELKDAQEASSYNRLMANLGAAGATIGHSLAGMGQQKSIGDLDVSGFRKLADQADAPVKDLLQQREQASSTRKELQAIDRNDPSSKYNVDARAAAKARFGINIPDSMTMDEYIQNVHPMEKLKQHKEEIALKNKELRMRESDKRDAAKQLSDDRNSVRFAGSMGTKNKPIESALNSANSLDHLLSSIESGELTDSNTINNMLSYELANVANAGRAATVSGVDRTKIDNLATKAAKFKEFLANKPTSAELNAYIPQLKQEVQLNKDAMAESLVSSTMAHASLAKGDWVHDAADNYLRERLAASGVDPEQIKATLAQRQAAAKDKTQKNKQAEELLKKLKAGNAAPAPSQAAEDPDVIKYQQHYPNLTMDQARSIVQQRKAKMQGK